MKQNIYTNFKAKKDYNKNLIDNTEFFIDYPFEKLQIPNEDNLNILRQKLGAEVLTNIEKNKNENIFYIEAPTGGGKTNMSMVAIFKLLQLHPEINKVFYVFPFTTLITQTANAIKETLGLSDNDIALLHSKAGYQEREYSDNEVDAFYGKGKRNDIDNLFVNYPFVLLTHIRFFDILKSNDKGTNYILHRLANSIVIIDELQSYNPKEWDKIKYFITKYAKLFNIRFILMSATLPKIDEIKLPNEENKKGNKNFVQLIDKPEKYLQNPNFSKRVFIQTNLLDKKIEIDELSELVLKKSKEYAKDRIDGYNGSVYTIIEFIFKKSASEFYQTISEQNDFFDEIFVLSGTIIEPRRKYIINYLKDDNNRKKKILLITTQVVEAGVDIDMDLGFKNRSLIDSDEQLAGRINRNVKKQDCELYLFNHDDSTIIYGKDPRYKVSQNFTKDFVAKILSTKDFGELYNKVFERIEQTNSSAFRTNLNDYLTYFNHLDFRAINDNFRLIDSQTSSIFVPAEINVHCYGTENNFSNSEITFISNNSCFVDNSSELVSGEKIWNLYVSTILNKQTGFSEKKRSLKILNGIMSKFIFSIFSPGIKKLKPYLDNSDEFDDYAFNSIYKIRSDEIGENRVYGIESGINDLQLKKESTEAYEFI
ncbi:MAG: CRISPR-associated helicase Cas3' [Chlorobi bacterium]|nr:CRISPR-associated helicase Cas3' [Chlorobiota bacterium]